MREISADTLKNTVEKLYLDLSYHIGADVESAVKKAIEAEASPTGRETLQMILDNYHIAAETSVAICQDTGMAILFIDMGQEVHITGGGYEDAIHAGVRAAYENGYLRKSVVDDPLFNRVNTRDNTPALIYTRVVPGDQISVLALAKGFGSENMSALKMLIPADGVEGARAFVLDTVRKAGPNPCPPVIVGVGIGGSMEYACLMAKRATARAVDTSNPDPRYAKLEDELLTEINRLGIGPGGTGGKTTALKVNIEYAPTHIAGLPVAVNICCHAARHAQAVI